MECHACAAATELGSGERIGFHDACAGCGADLHVCANCSHRDPAAYNACRESSAERVEDPERANRCEYFRPGDRPGGDPSGTRASRLADLEALFEKS